MPLIDENARYTYTDYCRWDDGGRWELIDGVPYAMAPGAVQQHQDISGALFNQFYNYLKGKHCKVYHPPFDVRLNAGEGDNTVVQPDILIVCDHSKLDGKCCNGAPDMVIEILSPSSARHDRIIKFQRYQRAGIREYWIVDPETQSVQACTLNDNGNYVTIVYTDLDIVPVSILPGCAIPLNEIFAE